MMYKLRLLSGFCLLPRCLYTAFGFQPHILLPMKHFTSKPTTILWGKKPTKNNIESVIPKKTYIPKGSNQITYCHLT